MTFVDEIGVERDTRELGAANDDVVRRFTLEPNDDGLNVGWNEFADRGVIDCQPAACP